MIPLMVINDSLMDLINDSLDGDNSEEAVMGVLTFKYR